jgi:membrane protease YdiL (CAAX protease family)
MQTAGWSRSGIGRFRPSWLAIGIVVLVGIAALVRPVRPFVLMALLFAYGLARWRGDRTSSMAAVTAGALPMVAILAWGSLGQPPADPTGADCTNLFAPPALWRFFEAFVGLAAIALLIVDRRATWAELGLRAGSHRTMLLAAAGLLVGAPLAIWGGSLLGQSAFGGSFFGSFALDLSQPLALLPAALFAVSNAFAEELAYRGSMRVWLVPGLGVIGANLAQAIVFGLAHIGQDFVGPVAPTAVAMIAAGFVAGVITRRTRSLAIVLAVHIAADVPLFLYWACRAG